MELKQQLLQAFDTFAVAFKAIIENAFKEEEPIITKKRPREEEVLSPKEKEEEESNESDDGSFINNNSEVSEWSSSVIDAEVVENNYMQMKNPDKRQSTATKLLNIDNKVPDYDHPERKDKGSEYCGDYEVSDQDGAKMKSFCVSLHRYGMEGAILNNTWWMSHFGDRLNIVLNGMGRQGKNNQKAKAIVHDIINTCCSDMEIPLVYESDYEHTHTQCSFCYEKRICGYMLQIGKRYYPLGSKCYRLADALIEFFTILYAGNDNYRELYVQLLGLMDNIIQSHENKAKNFFYFVF